MTQPISPGTLFIPPAPGNNPSNLNADGITYFGTSAVLTAQAAWDAFRGSRNPFIEGTSQSTEYLQIVEEQKAIERNKWLRLPEFPSVIRPSKRRLGMPRFTLHFDTEHDARLRLCGSFIFIGKDLVYCRDVRQIDQDYLLVLEAGGGKTYRAWYSSDAIDLRSPEPQYIVYQNRPAFFGRHPTRQQRQGVSSENTYVRFVGHTEFSRIHDFSWMTKKLDTEDTIWTSALSDLMVKAEAFSALRLSKNIAFYLDDDTVKSEYKGRYLGEVNENSIKVDEIDQKPWIDRDVKRIGCTLRT